MKTKMTELFDLEAPIAQAPMGRCAPPEMAAAVANAGGLGMLGVSWDSLETIESHIKRVSELTDKHIAMNFCLQMDQRERITFALKNGVKIISLFWGDPTPFVDEIKSHGAKLIVSVGSIKNAERAIRAGADALCAQNHEAGGHVYSKVGGFSLTAGVVEVAEDRPVIAAGGITNGRGLASALALGADGVWLGTRFLLSNEAQGHPKYIDVLKNAGHDATVVTELFDLSWPNAPHRIIPNSTYNVWLNKDCKKGESRPGSSDVVAYRGDKPIYRYDEAGPTVDIKGDIEAMPLYAGQGVGLINDIKPVATIVSDIMSEAKETLSQLNHL